MLDSTHEQSTTAPTTRLKFYDFCTESECDLKWFLIQPYHPIVLRICWHSTSTVVQVLTTPRVFWEPGHEKCAAFREGHGHRQRRQEFLRTKDVDDLTSGDGNDNDDDDYDDDDDDNETRAEDDDKETDADDVNNDDYGAPSVVQTRW